MVFSQFFLSKRNHGDFHQKSTGNFHAGRQAKEIALEERRAAAVAAKAEKDALNGVVTLDEAEVVREEMDVGQNGRPMWDHRCECLV